MEIDKIVYKLEEIDSDIDEVIRVDREYFYERRIELMDILFNLIEKLENK